MDISLLDCIIKMRPINLGYVILRHMLSPPRVNYRLILYGSIITNIFKYLYVLHCESVYKKTERISEEAIIGIRFYERNEKWVKTTTSKNWDIVVAYNDMSKYSNGSDQESNIRDAWNLDLFYR